MVFIRLSTSHGFRHPWGVLERMPPGSEGSPVVYKIAQANIVIPSHTGREEDSERSGGSGN